MKWIGKIANDFPTGTHLRWYDRVSVIIWSFPIILVRRYDWQEDDTSTTLIMALGFEIYCKVKETE